MIVEKSRLKSLIRRIVLLTLIIMLSFALATQAVADINLRSSTTSSAGGQSSCEGLAMNSTTGQSTPIGLTLNSYYRQGAGFWYQNPLPPPRIQDLIAHLDSGVPKSLWGHIRLSWTEPDYDMGIAHYVIYRSNTGYQLGDSLAMTANATYLDYGVVGNLYMQNFYTDKAVDWAGNKSAASNQVGEFDRLLER
jgi:hypothetical protein